MLLPVVVDNLNTIARSVCDKDAPGFGIERGMVKVAIRSVGYFDNAQRFQRHDDLAGSGRRRKVVVCGSTGPSMRNLLE
jgi:hypothetical protein